MDYRGAWNLKEWMECESGIELEESHKTSCPIKYSWNGKDLRDHSLKTVISNYSQESKWLQAPQMVPFIFICFMDQVILAKTVWMKDPAAKTKF